jgi:hypothetical protein
VAAADGGLVVVLADRGGLMSCVLFFLDRPGPAVERAEVFDLGCGRIGEDSLDGIGEFAADGFRFGWNFFVVTMEDVDNSRTGLEVVEGG